MSSARSVAALDPGRSVVEQLRERVAAMERKPATQPVATLPALASLVPLHAGATYAVDSASLALALAAGASQAGEWVGFAGCADFGVEAAAELAEADGMDWRALGLDAQDAYYERAKKTLA